ncbi:MAG: hypothetical protein ACREF9_20065, partial [Opitutaceae bacterium]
FNQRPAFEEKVRLFGAVTWQPFTTTSIRANFETGRTRANRPITVLPYNSVSQAWFDAGRPTYDWSFYDDPARNPAAPSQIAGANFWHPTMGLVQLFEQIAVVYSRSNAATPDASFRGQQFNSNGTVVNTIRNNLFHPLVNRDLAIDEINFIETRNVANLPPQFWPDGFVPPGIKFQGFTDFSAFDFKQRMLDETSRQGDSFHAFNIAVEQRAWRDRIGIEVAYDQQRYDARTKNTFFSAANGNHVFVDTGVTLPTGQRNPNVGRPFVYGGGPSVWRNTFSEKETWRATGFLRYDFKDAKMRLGRWLGRHALTALYDHSADETIAYTHRLTTSGAAAEAVNPAAQVFARQPGVLVYMGDSVLGGAPLRLEPVRVPELMSGITVPTTYFAAPAGSPQQGDFVVTPTVLLDINNGGSVTREVIKSRAAVLQSHWLADHLVTTAGWRRDADYFVRRAISFDAAHPTKVHYGFDDFSFPRTPPPNVAKETISYSGVLRWPHKLWRLPRGADLSVFYNVSENFTPIGGQVDIYSNILPPPQGETKEYGLNFSLFDQKLTLRVNRFETKVVGQSNAPAVFDRAASNA